jgi:hypothetical protein
VPVSILVPASLMRRRDLDGDEICLDEDEEEDELEEEDDDDLSSNEPESGSDSGRSASASSAGTTVFAGDGRTSSVFGTS